jgi:hypothetical protein
MNEDFKAWTAMKEAENAKLQTSPPTRQFNGPDVDYPADTHVKWVCCCGSDKLEVYSIEGDYETYVVCPICRGSGTVHSG